MLTISKLLLFGGSLVIAALIKLLSLDHHAALSWQQYSEGDRGEGLWLPSYRTEQEAVALKGFHHNLSGITFNADSGRLWAVAGTPDTLIELSDDLSTLRSIALPGITDPEAVSYIGNGRFAIADERQHALFIVHIEADTNTINKEHILKIDLSGSGGNKGIEGLATDLSKMQLYAGHERDPIGLTAITLEPHSSGIQSSEAINIDDLPLQDISGLHYDSHSGNLLILSDQSRLLLEVSPSGEVISHMKLWPGFAGLTQFIADAEGVAVDDRGRFYIISEPNLLYRFAKSE